MDATVHTKDPHRVEIGRKNATRRWAGHPTVTLRLGDLSAPMAAAIRQLVAAAREGDAENAKKANPVVVADVTGPAQEVRHAAGEAPATA